MILASPSADQLGVRGRRELLDAQFDFIWRSSLQERGRWSRGLVMAVEVVDVRKSRAF